MENEDAELNIFHLNLRQFAIYSLHVTSRTVNFKLTLLSKVSGWHIIQTIQKLHEVQQSTCSIYHAAIVTQPSVLNSLVQL